jgi:hypothetical protein
LNYVETESNYSLTGQTSSKRIIRVPSFLRQVDVERKIYPKGIIVALKELSSFNPFRKISRVEWFADQRAKIKGNEKVCSKKKFGILREFFPAYSSEPKLIEFASSSSSVIEVHAKNINEKKLKEARSDGMFSDKLILKEAESPDQINPDIFFTSYRERTSKLYVTSHWLDLAGLRSGDIVIVSNPREEYEMPPPLTCLSNY